MQRHASSIESHGKSKPNNTCSRDDNLKLLTLDDYVLCIFRLPRERHVVGEGPDGMDEPGQRSRAVTSASES